MALGIVPGDPDSATKAFADLKTKLDMLGVDKYLSRTCACLGLCCGGY
jgi:hypothetical protein